MGYFDDHDPNGAAAMGYESDGSGGYKMEYTAEQLSGTHGGGYSYGGYGGYGGGSRKRRASTGKTVCFRVEIAKSNRIKCDLPSCGRTITNGDLKLQKRTSSDYGSNKAAWRHADCFFKNKTKDLTSLGQITGLEALEPGQVGRLTDLYYRKYHPSAAAAGAARRRGSLPVSPVTAAGAAATAAVAVPVAAVVATAVAPAPKRAKTGGGQQTLTSFFAKKTPQPTAALATAARAPAVVAVAAVGWHKGGRAGRYEAGGQARAGGTEERDKEIKAPDKQKSVKV